MTVIASPRAGHQMAHQKALAEGLIRHGIDPILSHSIYGAQKHVACWGWREGKILRDRGHEVLVMERGYLGDRFAWTSLAWNGLNGYGTFPAYADDNGERFSKQAAMKPWKEGGGYVLLMGQVPGDASLKGRNMMPWYSEAAMKAQTAYEMPVKFRAHPMAVKRGIKQKPQFTEPSGGSLDEALEGAAVVVTWNSNSGVDAVLAGVPTVTMDPGSMAWDVTAHRIGDLARPDRKAWAHQLAWKQWTIDEIASGEALTGLFKSEVA